MPPRRNFAQRFVRNRRWKRRWCYNHGRPKASARGVGGTCPLEML